MAEPHDRRTDEGDLVTRRMGGKVRKGSFESLYWDPTRKIWDPEARRYTGMAGAYMFGLGGTSSDHERFRAETGKSPYPRARPTYSSFERAIAAAERFHAERADYFPNHVVRITEYGSEGRSMLIGERPEFQPLPVDQH